MAALAVFLCGLLLGLGLLISGMTQPAKVLNFLDVSGISTGTWDPSLALVMASALIVAGVGYRYARRRSQPYLASQSFWPTRTDIDPSLVFGAVVFGAGWGLVGLCPGPALINFVTLSPKVFVFVAAMVFGMILHDRGWAPWAHARRYGPSHAADD